jgi:hypothetical protein
MGIPLKIYGYAGMPKPPLAEHEKGERLCRDLIKKDQSVQDQ